MDNSIINDNQQTEKENHHSKYMVDLLNCVTFDIANAIEPI